MHSKFFIIVFFLFLYTNCYSQNYAKILKSLSFEDKIWVAKNPNNVLQAKKISEDVIKIMDSLYKAKFFGVNEEGGIFDAFRHIYWMYNLANEIGDKAARRIGRIYENYNKYLFFNCSIHGYDKAGVDMDLFNNDLGISISDSNFSKDVAINYIRQLIIKGEAKVIKKSQSGESLNVTGEIIPDSVWKKSWDNERVLIYSNQSYELNK